MSVETNGYVLHSMEGLLFDQPSVLHALGRGRVMDGRMCEAGQAN